MKLTRDQITAKQSITPEGWNYDWRYAVIHNEHSATRSIRLDENGDRVLKAQVYYAERTDWRTRTTTKTPTVNVSIYHKRTNDFYAAYGLGVFEEIGCPQPTKNYKALCKFAAELTDEHLLQLAGVTA